MTRIHLSDLHLAHRFTEAFERALHCDRPVESAPARAVPPAKDWPEWDWEHKGGAH